MTTMAASTREASVRRETLGPCLLGFVDDVENPDEEARQAASELALGFVSLGLSSVLQMGHGSREGEVRLQRDPETGIFIELTTQCDGLDNDCDGVIDDETYLTLMVMDLRAVVPVVQAIVGSCSAPRVLTAMTVIP